MHSRTPAWTGARASPTFSPPLRAQASPAPTQIAFPSLSQNGTAPHDRVLQSLAGLTVSPDLPVLIDADYIAQGTTVTLITKTAQRYEGVVVATTGEGDTTGVTLKDAKELTAPGAPLKDTLFIATTNIDTWASGPADAKPPAANGNSNGDCKALFLLLCIQQLTAP